jgi:NADPH:quinone reductase-like Zn-dependent oxidoreductase
MLARLIERRQLRPVIDRVVPLERLTDAHRAIEAGGMRGKIAVTVAH